MHQLDVLRDNDSCFESFSSKEYINKEMIKEAKYLKKQEILDHLDGHHRATTNNGPR